MARYVQRITLLGKQRWIGWEIDGVGTEIAGLQLADELSEEELQLRGVKEFRPLAFENFLGMGSSISATPSDLLDEDIIFRLDALRVGMERIRHSGGQEVPRSVLAGFFAEETLEDPRVQQTLRQWEASGTIELVGEDACYLRIRGPLA